MMPSTIEDGLTIRDVGEGDRSGLRDLWAATWQATYGPLIGRAAVSEMIQALTASDLRDMLPAKDEERAGVAVRAGRIIGSAIMAERGHIAFLWGMYVHPAEQRQGVGTALLRHVVDRLVAADAVEVRVLESSPWAVAFYRRCGFVEERREAMPLAAGCPPVPGLVMSASPTNLLRRRDRITPARR